MSPFPLFFFNIALAIWNPLPHEFEFHVNLRVDSSSTAKKGYWILIGNVLNLYVNGFG